MFHPTIKKIFLAIAFMSSYTLCFVNTKTVSIWYDDFYEARKDENYTNALQNFIKIEGAFYYNYTSPHYNQYLYDLSRALKEKTDKTFIPLLKNSLDSLLQLHTANEKAKTSTESIPSRPATPPPAESTREIQSEKDDADKTEQNKSPRPSTPPAANPKLSDSEIVETQIKTLKELSAAYTDAMYQKTKDAAQQGLVLSKKLRSFLEDTSNNRLFEALEKKVGSVERLLKRLNEMETEMLNIIFPTM